VFFAQVVNTLVQFALKVALVYLCLELLFVERFYGILLAVGKNYF
jgi:hypothetical protein